MTEDKMKVTYRCPLCREVTHGKQGDICLDCEKWLRENKWLHKDDKVEGKRVCALTLKPDIDLNECPPCACADCPKMRPALVKDMIK